MLYINDWVHIIAGILILGSLALGLWVSPYWYLFTAFVGANLFQYGVSKVCPMAVILRKIGVRDPC
jgi:hypothetical protein